MPCRAEAKIRSSDFIIYVLLCFISVLLILYFYVCSSVEM